MIVSEKKNLTLVSLVSRTHGSSNSVIISNRQTVPANKNVGLLCTQRCSGNTAVFKTEVSLSPPVHSVDLTYTHGAY